MTDEDYEFRGATGRRRRHTHGVHALPQWLMTAEPRPCDMSQRLASVVIRHAPRVSLLIPPVHSFFHLSPPGARVYFTDAFFPPLSSHSAFTSSASGWCFDVCQIFLHRAAPDDMRFQICAPRLAHAHARKLLWQRHIHKTLANKLYAGTRTLKPHDTDREYWLEETWQESHDITTAQSRQHALHARFETSLDLLESQTM